MEKKNFITKDLKPKKKTELSEEKPEKELDADSKVHETSPDLIQKEDHYLPVDDEVKEG